MNHECMICGFAFQSHTGLAVHVNNIHGSNWRGVELDDCRTLGHDWQFVSKRPNVVQQCTRCGVSRTKKVTGGIEYTLPTPALLIQEEP